MYSIMIPKRLAILLSLAAMVGCNEAMQFSPSPRPSTRYDGGVKVNKTNAKVTSLVVTMPGNANDSDREIFINNRQDAMNLVAHLESLLTDLKTFSEQFPIDETVPPLPPEKGQAK